MLKLSFAALLAAAASAVQAAPPAPAPAAIAPSIDSAEERQVLRNLSACLAERRPAWARQTLAEPYLSKEQARQAAQALGGDDTCLKGEEVEVTFRTSGVVGSLAEHFLKADMARADAQRLATVLNTMEPKNASEDFGLCVSAGDPDSASALAMSEPGSDAESKAVGQLAVQVSRCMRPGETLSVDVQALRALVSTALYRGVTTALASRS